MKKEIHHTPGPWKWDEQDPEILCSETKMEEEHDACGGVVSRYNAAILIGHPENSADAILIAAAPELLAALQAITDHFAATIGGRFMSAFGNIEGGVEENMPTIKNARVAIARATGR